jgi:hypothetical protein
MNVEGRTSRKKGRMKRLALTPLIFSLALSACLPQPATPAADLVATSVSATLTQQAVASALAPTQPPVFIESPPPTLPSDTPAVTVIVPSPTETASPTPTATTSPTSVSGDPRTALGQPTWRDPFDSGNGWNVGEDSFTRVEVEDGKFVLTGRTTADGWRLTWPEVKDVYLEATIRTGTCQSTDEYGLMFRVPDIHDPNEGYLFGFTCDGRYFLRTWDGEDMVTLTSLTTAAAIQAGTDKSNRIGVWAEGNDFRLYANGTLLAEIEDTTFPDTGGFGFFIGARQTDNFTVEADEIAYWDID